MAIAIHRGGMLAMLLACTCAAQAQTASWSPRKNVEIIAPAGPGSALDQTARVIQRVLQAQKAVESPVTVVNKAGGGQALGFTYLNQHQGDGHYLSIGTISLLTNRITGVNPLGYDDITPVANLVAEYVVFAVRTESPIRDGKDFGERVRASPNAISVAFSGTPGNHNHMAIGLVGKAAGADVRKLKTVVFSSGGELTAAALGGHVDVAVGGSSVFASQVQAGRMRLLGVTSPKRLGGALAAVPTWTEHGYPASFATFRGIVGPRGMPPDQVRFWEAALRKMASSGEWKEFLQQSDSESFLLGSAEYRKFLESEYGRVRGVLTDLGLAK